MEPTRFISSIQQSNLLRTTNIECNKLTGGVSSDIYLISDGVNKYVVKQARKKLLVEDEWFADTARNKVEREFAQYVQHFLPGAVPHILYVDKELDFFVMEYLDQSFDNWKKQLMEGNFNVETAKKAADLLAHLHVHTFCNQEAEEKFHSNLFFKSLRTEPYLVTTGNRNPQFKEIFHEEAERLLNWREALIHGDFSPKNIMAGQNHVVLLDHEVACYGDPAFDIAFFLNHLYLKQLYHAGSDHSFPDLAGEVWKQYSGNLDEEKTNLLMPRIGKLLLLLMLARIDGKSPVEYLSEEQKQFVRNFVSVSLKQEVYLLDKISQAWNYKLKTQFRED